MLIENLFYKRNVEIAYDLKGNQRNRESRSENDVQLDGNFL